MKCKANGWLGVPIICGDIHTNVIEMRRQQVNIITAFRWQRVDITRAMKLVAAVCTCALE
jgi:hypothetical protein